MINAIDQAGLTSFEINKVGWIGNTKMNLNRSILLNIGNMNTNIFDFS
jgi:hypothetical protein